MQITAKTWNEYITRLSRLNQKAGQLMREYIGSHDTESTDDLIAYAYGLVTKYGEGSAELACQMYDALAEAANAGVPAAEPAEPADYGEVARMVNATKNQNPANLPNGVSRLVKRAGADTTLKNAARDGAEWAWVPHGDTCPFCITLASNGWQKASSKVLKGGHAEHIHANCDCEFAIRFDHKTTVAGYDPDKYLAQYNAAGGDINKMRRVNYAANKERINAQKRAAYAEQRRRKTGEQGQEIIDKPTYNKLTKDFLKHGGLIIRGEEAVKHLEKQGAYASYFMGGNFAFIRDDATVSDVLEEMYHALQDRKNMFAEYSQEEMLIRREIDAQKYLISVAERYKIPIEETNVTKQNLANYEERLKERLNGKEGQKE